MPGPTLRLGDPGAGNLRFEVDDERDEYLHAKGAAGGLWSSDSIRSQLEAPVLRWFRAAIERDQPALSRGNDTLDQLVANIQEDVVIMHREATTPAISARAVYVNVCFPSGWCPPCTCGKSFIAIHAPVPNAAAFDGAGRRTGAELLFGNEDAVRFVWSLTPDPSLDRRICHGKSATGERHESASVSWESPERLYLRVERQVIAPIDANTACFLIRVYRYALDDLDLAVRAHIRASVATMPEKIREYKGIAGAHQRILALIEDTLA
jgi:hypothetical protein